MTYKQPQWILRPQEADEELEAYSLCYLRKAADYRSLQRWLALDEETLYNCTYHRFAARLCSTEDETREETGRQGITADDGEIVRPLLRSTYLGFQPYGSARVCPSCLCEGIAYGRLYWNFTPIAACLRHNVFLVNRCPGCHKPIPLMRPSLTHCPHCRSGDYRQAQGVMICEGPFFYLGQELILHCLTGETTKPKGNLSLLAGSPLLALAPRDYWHLLWAFRYILPDLFPDDPFLQVGPELRSQLRPRTEMRNALTLRDWGALTATFHYIFASWPEHFFAFLDALIRSRGGERRIESHEKRNLGPIGYELIYGGVSPPAFLFLREPYEDYLRTRFIGESRLPAAERYSVSHAQARDALDVFPDEVDGLIDHGFLRVARGPLRIQNKTFKSHIERESVERLRSEWKGLLPFHRVVALLGAGWSIMRMLREEEWLKPLRGPDIDGYPVDLYRSSEVDALLSAMALRTIATPYVAGESITLGALFTSRLAGMSAILEAILGGELIPADTGAAKPFFRRLALTRVQILRWRNASRIKCEGSLLLTQKEVAEVLGVSNHEVVRLVARGLLDKEGGEGPGLFFCWKAIETFCQTYVFLREARALLDVYPVTVSKYLRERNIQPVLGGNSAADRGVLLFRLEDICSLLVDKPIV